MTMIATPPPPTSRRGLLIRLALGSLVVVLATAAATVALVVGVTHRVAADLALGGKPFRSSELTAAKFGAPQTILIIGDDHIGPTTTYWTGGSDNVHGIHLLHADTMMLVRLDPNAGQTSTLSIPRDLLVNFSYRGHYYSDQKFNSAYSIGGPGLVLKVAEATLPGLTVNHVVDFNFASFLGVVQALGCVYVDVDRRYYNPVGDNYSAINIEPGYQQLCGETALSYVRYRHTDSDFVRVARQQDFIRQAKDQVGVLGLVSKYPQLARAFGRAVLTDIRGSGEVTKLLELVALSTARPIRQVPFQVSNVDSVLHETDYVTASAYNVQQTVRDFLAVGQGTRHASAVKAAEARRGRGRRPGSSHHSANGLPAVSSSVQSDATQLAPKVPFPVLVPAVQTQPAIPNDFYAYTVSDQRGRLHHGYRIDWQQNGLGGYYGIEGMDWPNPPLFANASRTATIGGRRYMFIDDGSHVHDVGWREGRDLYWVSNTLLEDLSNSQMLVIAESVRTAG